MRPDFRAGRSPRDSRFPEMDHIGATVAIDRSAAGTAVIIDWHRPPRTGDLEAIDVSPDPGDPQRFRCSGRGVEGAENGGFRVI
jgi:hypothetical protein